MAATTVFELAQCLAHLKDWSSAAKKELRLEYKTALSSAMMTEVLKANLKEPSSAHCSDSY